MSRLKSPAGNRAMMDCHHIQRGGNLGRWPSPAMLHRNWIQALAPISFINWKWFKCFEITHVPFILRLSHIILFKRYKLNLPKPVSPYGICSIHWIGFRHGHCDGCFWQVLLMRYLFPYTKHDNRWLLNSAAISPSFLPSNAFLCELFKLLSWNAGSKQNIFIRKTVITKYLKSEDKGQLK